MSSITGVEFGPDSCVLVRARKREEAIELSSAHVIEAWPPQDAVATELLKRVRQEHGFPRIARVVAWGLAEGAGPRDPATRAALRPLLAAGFRLDSVMSPPQALAILASSRPRTGAVAWLAVNRQGAAVAIVRSGQLLYGRAFGWNWEAAAVGSQAQLLQRYSIVAHLAPEVRRGADLVRMKYGAALEAAITCGDLPDLRSLTMPLIEELDLEVETLDSAEGLLIPTNARRDRLPDSLSAVRLACAAAAGPPGRGLDANVVRLVRAGAAVAAAGGLGVAGLVWWMRPQPRPAPVTPAATVRPQEANRAQAPPVDPGPSSTASAAIASPAPPISAPSSISTAPADDSSPLAPESARPAAPNPNPPRANRPSPRVEMPQTAGAPVLGADRPRTAQSAPASTDTPRARPERQPQVAPPQRRAAVEPGPPEAARPADAGPASRGPRPAPLKEPLPVIDTILVSSDRRLAVVDGAVVGVGDMVGPRTVARIEVDAVFLREPSGHEIRVPIRVRRAP